MKTLASLTLLAATLAIALADGNHSFAVRATDKARQHDDAHALVRGERASATDPGPDAADAADA
jgi:hypothetical protein